MELCDIIEYKKFLDIIILDKRVLSLNIRSKVLKIRNLPVDGKKIGQIKAKPYGFIVLFLLTGIAMLFTAFYVVGIIIAGVFTYYLLFVKDILLVEFFETHAVFYLNNGKDECFLLFWDDIDHWEIISSRRDFDVLNIILKNQQTIALKCLGRKKIVRYFEAYASGTGNDASASQHAL